jgi:hypothetical protein
MLDVIYRKEETTMNRVTASIMSLAAALSFMAVSSAAQTNTFKGEITDEHLNCVQTPVKAPEGVTNGTACVLYWAHFAAEKEKYVLYDTASKTVYHLDDQDLVQPYVAAKVEVTGTLNEATKTIKVTGIKVDESAYKSGAHS